MSNNLDESNIILLKQVYEDLLFDRDKLEKEVHDNNDKIKEIDIFLKSLYDKEDVEFEFFSPRNVQYIYREKIQNQNSEKDKLVKANNELNCKIDILTVRINKLGTVLKSIDESIVKNSIKDDTEDFLKDIDDTLLEKIEKEKLIGIKNNILLSDYNTELKDSEEIKYLILDMQEKERQRIARDLHDNTVQSLTHLIHKIELSSKFVDQDIIRAKMELLDVNRKIKIIINDMRNIIFYLRPMEFDDIGLKATFDKYFTEIQIQTNMQISYSIDDIIIPNQLVSISIFHIVKECVNNAIKYSNANNLKIEIKEIKSNIYIHIEDDGIGFDISKTNNKHHFGLLLTKENVSILKGKFDIKSILNKGTIITICLPSYSEGSNK